MQTPGPWRCVPTDNGEYFTHRIEITEGHIASIVGWSVHGATCPITEANARLIEHAPDMASALNDLLVWATIMGEGQQGSLGYADGRLTEGGWQAPCWERARCVLGHATGSPEPHAPEPIGSATEMVEKAGRNEGWNDRTKLSLLLDFLDAEAIRNPVIAGRLRLHRDCLKIGGVSARAVFLASEV